MTSKERVRLAAQCKKPDRVPTNLEGTTTVWANLLKHYGYSEKVQLLDHFQIDMAEVFCDYCGPELKDYRNAAGNLVVPSFWGYEKTIYEAFNETTSIVNHFPLKDMTTPEEINAYAWPSVDWFDFESLKRACAKYPDKAIIFGHEGPFQEATFLRPFEDLMMDMIEDEDFAGAIFDRMFEFEMEYYTKAFEAADGQIDILRTHDDYGTQISMLFGVNMWKKYFAAKHKALADLAHKNGAFYQLHSCGAVGDLIPEIIACGVDILEPLQKVRGLEPEKLQAAYGGQICFHGGIDVQELLPRGTKEEVIAETRRFLDVLGKDGGYILMASQAFLADVPIENIEALYSVER